MKIKETEELEYPIGRVEKTVEITGDVLNNLIADISTFPSSIISEVINLTDEQLDTRYRLGIDYKASGSIVPTAI